MREVERAASTGDGDAARALAVHDHRLAGAVAAMAAALGGLDALVFTGGAGEGSARLRAEAGRRLGVPGRPDRREAQRLRRARRRRSPRPGAPARTLVVRAREEVVIARAVRRARVGSTGDGGP